MFDVFFSNLIFKIDFFEDRIGSGGFGEVFKVVKQSTKETMVIKVMRLGIVGTDTYKKNVKSVEAEIQVGIKLSPLCQFLVQISEFFIEGECCCLVMEFCSRGDLQKIFDSKNRISQNV
jgi:serine/threonine protein kinase